jgi:hypothetical protein
LNLGLTVINSPPHIQCTQRRSYTTREQCTGEGRGGGDITQKHKESEKYGGKKQDEGEENQEKDQEIKRYG